MIPYIILISVPIILYILLNNYLSKESTNKIIITVFFGILFILLAFRNIDIGIDLTNYKYYFETSSSMTFNEILTSENQIEKGYILLTKIVTLFTDNFQLFLIIVALLVLVPIYNLYKKNVSKSLIAIIIFVNMSTFAIIFSGLRQSIAIALGVLAYKYVKEKNIFKYILIVLLAISFHSSAFILLLMYPLYHIKINIKHLLIILSTLFLVYLYRMNIFMFLVQFLPEKYQGYEVVQTGAVLTLILYIIFLIYSYVITYNNRDYNINGLRNFLLLTIVIQIFASISTVAMRLGYYYIIYIPILISQVTQNSSKRFKQISNFAEIIIVIFFIIYFFYNASTGEDILQIFPYKFINL